MRGWTRGSSRREERKRKQEGRSENMGPNQVRAWQVEVLGNLGGWGTPGPWYASVEERRQQRRTRVGEAREGWKGEGLKTKLQV